MYAPPTLRIGDHYYVITARTPWIQFIYDQDDRGETARFLLSGDRPEFLQRQVWGEEKVLPGPWPFGLTMRDGPSFEVFQLGFGARLVGVALTAWALAHIIRHPRGGR